jgi:chemosensory pili system protein ChpA (sensor histidine kinase/response regulator)
MRLPDESLPRNALARRLEDLGGRLPQPASSPPDERDAFRRELEALQSEAEGLAQPNLAEALGRLTLLTEVGQCLAEDRPDAADEVAAFCLAALDRLAASLREDPGSDTEGPAVILRESAARWGDYLGLLDDMGIETPVAEDVPFDDPDESAFDPGMLLRLLTGGSTTGAADRTGSDSPPRPTPIKEEGHEGASAVRPSAATAPAPVATGPSPTPLGNRREDAGQDRHPPEPRRAALPLPDNLELDPEFREAFLAEAADLLERIEALVLDLDRDPCQPGVVHELGRCYHTLKGAVGSVGLVELAARIHALEEGMEGAREGATPALLDQFHESLHDLEATLAALGQKPPPPQAATRPVVTQAPSPQTSAAPVVAEEDAPARSDPASGSIRVPSERIDELIDLVSELISRRGAWSAQAEAVKRLVSQTRSCRDGLRNQIDGLHALGLGRSEPGDRPDAITPDGRLRRLAEQAEDLAVLAEATQAATVPLTDDLEILARLTLQLWDALQAIRIVPARGLFQRLARVAQEAARIEGRRIALVTVGEETGLDRAVQDKAYEPLLHIVRNAVGHGIEPPDERVRAGKSPQGRITLEAVREGSTLLLSVQDDGRGLDHQAILAKARRLGLVGPEETPSIDWLHALIFRSGFSTRSEANAISGRGVGMDVVAQEVARLRGTIELTSHPGQGTRIILRLPARLSLEQMIILRADGQPFALPVSLIVHAQTFEPEAVAGTGATATVLVRDERVPLVQARAVLGFSTTDPASCPKLLLVRTESGTIALVVDAIEGMRELVIKPLGPLLAGHPVIAGTSLAVSGEVILVLNPSGLSRSQREGRMTAVSAASRAESSPAARVLVVDDSISVRKVVVRRLRALGAEVEEVSDGLEALGKLRSGTYRLVLTDLEMPRMDGFELLAELQRWTELETPPVVVSSTASDPVTRRRVLALGARAFVAKPVDPDELAQAVSGLI